MLAWGNDTEGAKILIEAGADVNALGDENETPLHVAVAMENLDLIECLLKAGAKADIKSYFNETAHEKAIRLGGCVAKLFDPSIR